MSIKNVEELKPNSPEVTPPTFDISVFPPVQIDGEILEDYKEEENDGSGL